MVNLSREVVPSGGEQAPLFLLAVVPMFEPVVNLVSVEISRE
jgi:hypothetical protein